MSSNGPLGRCSSGDFHQDNFPEAHPVLLKRVGWFYTLGLHHLDQAPLRAGLTPCESQLCSGNLETLKKYGFPRVFSMGFWQTALAGQI